MMKAITYSRYGSPNNLELRELPIPKPGPDEVLIRVFRTAINPMDWHYLRGKPFLVRLAGAGIFAPKNRILGVDIAGTVTAVGSKVTRFKSGDVVFGACKFGGLAEYVCAPERGLQLLPDRSTLDQAASVAVAGITALQALRDRGDIHPGQKVLINGASGGVGTFAVQIAKHYGAEVTGVCSSRNIELVRSLGAHHVIDYTAENIKQIGRQFDIILDAAAFRPVSAYQSALKPRGKYIMIGGSMREMLRILLLGLMVRITSLKRMSFMMAKITSRDMAVLRSLLESGQLVPVTDRSYPMQDVSEAFEYLGTKRARGKVLIEIGNP